MKKLLQKHFIDTHQSNWTSISFILLASLASVLIMALIFPDLLIYHSLGFRASAHPAIIYNNSFTLLSHYYNGGVQLWNQYDQINYAFSHVGSGLYELANIITAVSYIFFSPIFNHQGELFHSLHSIVFFGSCTLIRTIGGYLLLRKFCSLPLIIFLGLIYLNTFLSSQMWFGFNTNNLYAYFPLLIYFILRFFEHQSLNDFLIAFTIMTIAVANSPMVALSYFYLGVHFFIISCILGAILKIDAMSINKLISSIKNGFNLNNILKIIITFGLCFIIMLPSLIMADSLKNDFYIYGSGLNETSGRFDNIFNIQNYFSNKTFHGADPKMFFIKSVDFWNNNWGLDWLFLGVSSIVFSFIGVLFSKDKRKHLFLWTIMFILLSNIIPPNQTSITSIGHWLNVLTNPFSFLVRSFHMTALLMPYLLLPLIVLGLRSCVDIIGNVSTATRSNRTPIAILLLIMASFYFAISLRDYVLIYGVFMCLLFLIFSYLSWQKNSFIESAIGSFTAKYRFFLLYGLLFIIFVIDLTALSIYIQREQSHKQDIIEHTLIDENGESISGIFDYQNPKILPFREYLRHSSLPDSLRGVNYRQTNYGMFYRFSHIGKYFYTSSVYFPRHISYKGMDADFDIRQYLEENNRLLFFADYAIQQKNTNITDILKNNLEKKVVLVDSKTADASGVLKELPEKGLDSRTQSRNSTVFTFPFESAQIRPMDSVSSVANYCTFKICYEYAFDLPNKFPSYLSTGVFTQDRNNLRLSIGNRKLKPVQGKLVEPFTFDVQNVNTGKLVVLLPSDFSLTDKTANLEVSFPLDLIDIWRNEHDNLGFTYDALNDGWLVFHYPYDKKWRLTVDGQSVEVLRVNNYFIGTPIKKGIHSILLQYWPDTWLREMILISIILISSVFVSAAVVGIRTENRTTLARAI